MSESREYGHLDPSVREYANETNDARIRRILADRWISFPHAETVLERMNRLLVQPRKDRMPCLLVTAPSGMGKTMIANRFVRDHPSQLCVGTGIAETRVLSIQMTDIVTSRRLYVRLLDALGAPTGKSQSVDYIETVAMHLMRDLGVHVLIIDEIQDVLVGSPRQQRACMNLLKYLTNTLQISLVAFGVQDAAVAIAVDPQIQSRFARLDIPRWRESDAFRGLLSAFERTLPLRKPSRLSTPTVARLLLRDSAGITGSIIAAISNAAVQAIESGEECVTEALIRNSFGAEDPVEETGASR